MLGICVLVEVSGILGGLGLFWVVKVCFFLLDSFIECGFIS